MGTTVAMPEVARLRRPSWRDTRLLVGVALVLASVALGARIVAAAGDVVPVWAARATLPAGSELTPETLTVVRVHLGSSSPRYLPADRPPPAGLVVMRTVGVGELVPRAAAAPAGDLDRRPVAVPVEGALPAGLAVGGAVDVWASARDRAGGGYAEPVRLARASEVVALDRPSGTLSAGRVWTVHVLLGQDQLPAVLDALANGARTAIVPLPGSAPAGQQG
jgi:hypothetical protein